MVSKGEKTNSIAAKPGHSASYHGLLSQHSQFRDKFMLFSFFQGISLYWSAYQLQTRLLSTAITKLNIIK